MNDLASFRTGFLGFSTISLLSSGRRHASNALYGLRYGLLHLPALDLGLLPAPFFAAGTHPGRPKVGRKLLALSLQFLFRGDADAESLPVVFREELC